MIGLRALRVQSFCVTMLAFIFGIGSGLLSVDQVQAASNKIAASRSSSSQIIVLKNLPKNQQVRKVVRSGTTYNLAFDLNRNSFRMDGKDLFVRTGKGGRYRLVDFLAVAMSKRPPTFKTRQGKRLSAKYAIKSAAVERKLAIQKLLERQLLIREQQRKVAAAGKSASEKKQSKSVKKNNSVQAKSLSRPKPVVALNASEIETAAGPGGGGELFGAIPVFSWLLDRLDVIPDVQAQDTPPSVTGADPILSQLLAQILIKREQDILAISLEHEAHTWKNFAQIDQRTKAGLGSHSDLLLAKNDKLTATLDVKNAEYRKILAVDAHQDRFNERLEMADYPVWKTAPPTDLGQLSARIGDDRILRAQARRHFRQRNFSLEALKLIDQMNDITVEIFDQYRQQFDLGRRTASELFGVQKMVLEIKIRRIRRLNDLMQTEANLQSIAGALTMDYVLHPGWQ